MRPYWNHSSYPATNSYGYSVVKDLSSKGLLAQSEGLEPSLAGLESAVFPTYTNPALLSLEGTGA